ncbi:MAG: CARDB domain-containing protein [Cyanobacteria bacterium J06642_3]
MSGSEIELIGTATNQGSTATIKSWKDKVYISDNETFEPSQDRLFGEFEHTETLEVGETKEVPINASLPQDIIGNKYVLIVSDADNDLKEAAGENNNVQPYPINIELAPYADLEVSEVEAPDLTIDDPATVKVSWKVTNNGTGNGYTDTWVDRVIASRDEIVGNQDDIVLDEFTHTGGLASGASYPMSEDILLPPAFTGRYKLFVQTDAEEKVFENGFEDNNSDRKKDAFFDVMPIPYADLRIDQVRTIGEANSGQPLTVNWTVRNDGIGITNTSRWNDRLYLASDPEGKDLVHYFGEFNRAGALANENPENTYQRTVQINLPEGVSGEHYLVAKTGGPFEFIYNDNNSLVSEAFDVNFTAPPDLKVTDIIAPDAITSGQKIDLTWTVANRGDADADGRWQDQIYLQEVGNPDANLISLASYSYEGDLLSGKSYTRQEKIKIPNELQGLYQVVVKTNSNQSLYEGNNTDNNQEVDQETLLVSLPPRPDLQVRLIDPQDNVSAGGTLKVDFDIINQGTAATNVPNWTDTVYLSLDNQISSDDIVIDTVDNKSALEPGQIYPSFTESIVIPKRFRGEAYIIVETDSSNQIKEEPQENNNTEFKKIEVEFEGSGTGGSGQPADLVTSDVFAPDQAFEGSTIEVRYKVTNKGIDTTDVNSWQDTIWLTKDKDRPSATNQKEGEVEDILLKTITHKGTLTIDGVNKEYEEVVQVKIPDQLTGEWYITPWSDTYDVVLEDTLDVNINSDDPNELDNNNYKARPITILLTPPPDLRVKKVNNIDQIQVTPEAEGGDPFEVTWTVENIGAGDTTDEKWFDHVYLSDKPTLNAPGSKQWFLGEFEHNGDLAPGGSYTETASFDLSPAARGKYVIVDVNAKIGHIAWEGPYTENNTGSTNTNVTRNPADLVVKQVDVPATSDSGESITVEWIVENEGADMWSGTKYWYDEVWISPDPTFIPNRATFAGSFIHTPEEPLKEGDSYPQSQEIVLPPGIEGDYYVYVSTDFSYQRDNGDFSGNLSSGSRYFNEDNRESYIKRGFEDPSNNLNSGVLPVIYKEPDLKVTDLKAPETGTAFSGETIPVTWTTKNIGTRKTRTNQWIDRIYLSRDASLDFTDTLLYEVEISLNILRQSNVFSYGVRICCSVI